jgi:histidinol-phosphate aminotransferase
MRERRGFIPCALIFFFGGNRMQKIKKRSNLEAIKAYVPGKPVEEVERELGVKVEAKLASNENSLGPSPLAIKAIIEEVRQVNLYPDGSCHYLRQALAAKFGISAGQVMVTNGADEAISMIARTYICPGDETVMPAPSFPQYESSTRIMAGKPVMVPLKKDFTYDIEAMLGAVNDNTRIIYLCTPNNPTGTILSKAELEEVLKRLPQNVLVVLDEAYYEYAAGPDYFEAIDYINSGYPVIALRTFSKIYGLAGLRVGYAIASEDIIRDMHSVREPFNVNRLAQIAATAALEDSEHIEKGLAVVEAGKKLFYDELSALGFDCVPTKTNFVFVNFKQPADKLFNELLKKGIIIRPGGIYGYPDYARITIGKEEENQKFLTALRRVISEQV